MKQQLALSGTDLNLLLGSAFVGQFPGDGFVTGAANQVAGGR